MTQKTVKNSFVKNSFHVMLPFSASLHLSLQSCSVVSPQVMSKGLQGRRDKGFISRDRPHHAERHTTSSSETHPGFISREPHHHKHTRSGAYTQWAPWIDMLHQSRSMSTQNRGAEGRRGSRRRETRRIIIQQRLCRWLGGSRRKQNRRGKLRKKGTATRGGKREREIKEKTQGDRKGKRKPSEVTAL